MIEFKYDDIRLYTATVTYKTTVALFNTFRRILGTQFKCSISAGEYIGKFMEKEIENTLESNRSN